tara:strand:- start:194 stop:1261 length:1068 start_codon:yes stop_codon:yes gene_type:complete
MKKLFLLIIIPFLSFTQEVDYVRLSNPSFVHGMYKGELISAFQWNDKLGNNIFIISMNREAYNYDYGNIETIYGYHYVIENLGKNEILLEISQLWDIKDWAVCRYDGHLNYEEKCMRITDLDNDGIAEITLGYSISPNTTDCCYPNTIKLIMHENGIKYAIRGESVVATHIDSVHQAREEKKKAEEKKEMYGRDSFKNAPKKFIDFASNLYDNCLMVNELSSRRRSVKHEEGVISEEIFNQPSVLFELEEDRSTYPILSKERQNYELFNSNRTAIYQPKPKYNCHETGNVVVRVRVNRQGETISAEPGVRGSTTSSACLMKEAKEAALQTKWEPGNLDSPEEMSGVIVYSFINLN